VAHPRGEDRAQPLVHAPTLRKDSHDAGSAVSSTVPSTNTTRMSFSVWYVFWLTPQHLVVGERGGVGVPRGEVRAGGGSREQLLLDAYPDETHAVYACKRACERDHLHAGGVVGHDAANHAGVNGRGVRPNLVLDGQLVDLGVVGQDAVHLAADEAGLHGYGAAVALRTHACVDGCTQ